MSKIGLIIKREYTTRIRKKSFLVMTLLGPLFFAGIVFLPLLLHTASREVRHVVVVDETHSFCGILNNTPAVQYDYSYCNFKIDQVRNIFMDSAHVSTLYIPAKLGENSQVVLYSKSDPNEDVFSDIASNIEDILERSKMKANNIDPAIINDVKKTVKVENIVNNIVTNSTYSLILGYVAAFLIYMFIFMYSVQVMRGVMEEKISRIVEIIISSVKPFHLMIGKVIGVCLVGLTQFLIWVTISGILFTLGSSALQKEQVNPANAKTEQTMKQGISQQDNTKALSSSPSDDGLSKQEAIRMGATALENIESTNWYLIIGCFIFYFLAGYLLYSSLFAAVGSAIDQETETQQFMLPLTAPLILSFVVMNQIIRDPQSSMAFWFSIIPFTSPITMMARIPFGVPIWQVLLSMALLLLGILCTIWVASRIYRVGLLMYGKKVTYKELGKWIFYK